MIKNELKTPTLRFSDFTSDWENKKLGDVCDINMNNINIKKPPKTIKYIDISSMGTGTYLSPVEINFSKAPSRAQRIINEESILISTVRPNLKQYAYIKNIEDINSILDKAVKACNESSDLITYTKKIKQNWDIKKRIEVIEMLWKVCLVDGVLEPYEDMLIRRISGLIYVDDKNRNLAKKNAIKKLDNYK